MLPALNGCSAAIARSTVDLPAPDTPISAQISPVTTSRCTPFSTGVAPRSACSPRTARAVGAFETGEWFVT
jgi:hypothetical protein